MGRVLVIAAHPDDEVLGCGGTMARLSSEGAGVYVICVAQGRSAYELQVAAGQAAEHLGVQSIEFLGYPDNQLDSVNLLQIVQSIEDLMGGIMPEVVYTHHAGDLNIDHSVTHRAVCTACRPQPNSSVKQLYFFEVPSSTEWMPNGTFSPNVFVDISHYETQKKKALSCYAGELRDSPHPRSEYSMSALATWRGATAGLYLAEAFMLGRMIR